MHNNNNNHNDNDNDNHDNDNDNDNNNNNRKPKECVQHHTHTSQFLAREFGPNAGGLRELLRTPGLGPTSPGWV